MTDPRPSHQRIEEAFKPAREMLDTLPEQTSSSDRARANLDTAEQYCHEIRDRMSRPPED
jgi:hypothetical protein